MTTKTKTVRDKVRYVIERHPDLAADVARLTLAVQMNFFGGKLTPPVTTMDDFEAVLAGRFTPTAPDGVPDQRAVLRAARAVAVRTERRALKRGREMAAPWWAY